MGEAQSTTTTTPPLHILFVSFPGQGHVNPLLRLAKRVASKGPLVTFSTTADFASSLLADPIPIPIGLGLLRFDLFPDSIYSSHTDLPRFMSNLEASARPALSRLLLRESAARRPVSCLVNNPFIPWALDVAADFNIPSAVLWIQSSAVFSIYHHFSLRPPSNFQSPLKLPGIPILGPADLPTFLLPSTPYKTLREVILGQFGNIGSARWVLANSYLELERDVLEALEEEECRVIAVGPLVEVGGTEGREAIKAEMWKADDECVEWLEKQEEKSVVYVSVGSVVKLEEAEMAELAFGLRNSGRPFLWVV